MQAAGTLVEEMGARAACTGLGVPHATFYRAHQARLPRHMVRRPSRSPLAFDEAEHEIILALLHTPEYVDVALRTALRNAAQCRHLPGVGIDLLQPVACVRRYARPSRRATESCICPYRYTHLFPLNVVFRLELPFPCIFRLKIRQNRGYFV